MGTSDTVRVGILGAGFMGSAHAECYDLLDIPIAMIASRSPGTITGNRPGTRWSSDIEEVINDPEVDCIDITLPNHLHLPAALACIRAGKPFLIEKPLLEIFLRARQLINASGKTRVNSNRKKTNPSSR